MTKDALVAGLRDVRQEIVSAAVALPQPKHDEVFLGSWSVLDLLAHLVGWDYTNIQAIEDIRQRRSPAVFARWGPDWASYNEELVAKYLRQEMADIVSDIKRSHGALIDHLESVPETEIAQDFGARTPRGETVTIAWYLQFEIDDEVEHLRQLLDWSA